MDVLGGRVLLSLSPLPDGRLMELAVIAADPPHQVGCSLTPGNWVAADTASIHDVGLLQAVSDPGRLREVAIGEMHVGEQCFRAAIDAPPNDPYLSGITKTAAPALDFVLLVSAMNEIVTGFT